MEYITLTLINEYGCELGSDRCLTKDEARQRLLELFEILEPGDTIEFGVITEE